jgi:hypothetical protein
MNRPKGRDKACNATDARARLDDARRFLEAAEKLTEPGNGDVVATNAIHSAISSADVLCCVALGRRSDDEVTQPPSGFLRKSTRTLQPSFVERSTTSSRPGMNPVICRTLMLQPAFPRPRRSTPPPKTPF